MSHVGRIFTGERAETRDPVTGNRFIRLSHHAEPDYASYYLNNGWLSDGRRLAFVSLRTGTANFFLADMESDRIVQATDCPGINVRRGSFYVDCFDRLYYWRTPELVRIDLNTLREEVIWRHPDDAFTSIPAVNIEGRLLIVSVQQHPTVNLRHALAKRALDLAGTGKTPAEVNREAVVRFIGVNLDTGSEQPLLTTHGGGYAVWSPTDPNRCWVCVGRATNPGPELVVIDWDGGKNVSTHSIGPRTGDELFDHPFWSADGRRVMFKYWATAYSETTMALRRVTKSFYELGWVDAGTERPEVQTVPLPFRNTHFNHMPGKDWLVGDGGFTRPSEMHVYRVDIKPAGCEFTSLGWHGNVHKPEWPYYREGYSEPCVKSNAQGTAISFTCSREGISPDVYVLALDGKGVADG